MAKKILILCEGQTEERFIKKTLAPALQANDVFVVPIIIATKRVRSGGHFKGGIPSYAKVRAEIQRLLGDTSVKLVTTMIDYYALPNSFPGRSQPQGNTPFERVQSVESAIDNDLQHTRFKSYLSLHEFEALLFSNPETIAAAFAQPELLANLQSIRNSFASPEHINEGHDTAPSKRLGKLYPRYGKPFFGSLIADRIGLATMRQACSHLNRWIAQLETT